MKNLPKKYISFLATGNEIVNGEVLDTNTHLAANLITKACGNIRSKITVNDNQQDITEEFLHLVKKNNAIITIGGLGPTSDDRTRFAISAATNLPLEMDNDSWMHLQNRLQKFGLNVSNSNKQQALFPKTANILLNEFGTANGCHLKYQNCDIFMLPGPPGEFLPIFKKYIMPYLEREHYFNHKNTFEYLTLGLSEGEISEKVDEIANQYGIEPAYCWKYPYLGIKVSIEDKINITNAITRINNLLDGFIVSTDGNDAKARLLQILTNLKNNLIIQASSNTLELLTEFNIKPLEFKNIQEDYASTNFPIMKYDLVWPQKNESQILKLAIKGYNHKKIIYQHKLHTPVREHDIDKYIQSYFAWQLTQFILVLN